MRAPLPPRWARPGAHASPAKLLTHVLRRRLGRAFFFQSGAATPSWALGHFLSRGAAGGGGGTSGPPSPSAAAVTPHPPPPLTQRSGKMAAGGGAGAAAEPGWEVAVRPLLSASYSAFEMKELPQLLASVIER